METKICTHCKEQLPKTNDYFFTKIIKQKLANGNIAKYHTFRSLCKKCHGKKGVINQQKKRCAELNCLEKDRVKRRWEEYSKKRMINPQLRNLGLSAGQIQTLNKKIKSGYIFTTVEQYKKDCRINVSKVKRKYDYGNIDFVPKKEKNRCGIVNLTDAYIANTLGVSVHEVPKEIIETKRLIIKINREIGITKFKK